MEQLLRIPSLKNGLLLSRFVAFRGLDEQELGRAVSDAFEHDERALRRGDGSDIIDDMC